MKISKRKLARIIREERAKLREDHIDTELDHLKKNMSNDLEHIKDLKDDVKDDHEEELRAEKEKHDHEKNEVRRLIKRMVREERIRMLSERDDTLERYLDGSYDGYQYGDPASAARRINEAIRMLVSATADELPNVGDALEPGFRKSILQTIISAMAAKGIKLT